MRLIAILLFLFTSAQAQTWTARSGVSMSGTGNVNGFYEYLPSTYNGVTKHPVVIFFHGIGEAGNGTTQLSTLLTQALPAIINASPSSFNTYGAVIICPQFTGSPGGYAIGDVIDYVRSNYVIDTNKIALTGYSAGAAGIIEWPDIGALWKITCMAVVAPNSVYASSIGNKFKYYNPKMRFFHGDADVGFTAYSNSVGWINGLNGAPSISPAAILTTLPGQGHNIDEIVYGLGYDIGNGQNMMQWLVAQTKASEATLVHTIIGSSGATLYKWKLYSDNTYTVESFNGSAWVTASGFSQTMRGVVSGTSYKWTMAGGGTYSSQTFISGNWQ